MLEQRTDTKTRLFLGLPIPDNARQILQEAAQDYPQYVEKTVPPEHWHMTLVFLGEVLNHKPYLSRLLKDLPQAYYPTVNITHVGRGLIRDQLWAYADPTPVILNMKTDLEQRLRSMRFPWAPPTDQQKDFVPHIHLASFFSIAHSWVSA